MTAHDTPRFKSDSEDLVPRALLRAMGALVLFSLCLVIWAVVTGRPPSAQVHTAAVVAERVIEIKARADGGTILTGADGTVLLDTPANQKGFITVVRNSLEFERKTHRVTGNPPVHLIRFADGRLGLRDDATGWKINLIGFGQDNARDWAEVMN